MVDKKTQGCGWEEGCGLAWGGGVGRDGGGGRVLTGPRLQRQDQDQGADHQLQAVEGPLPVSVFLVGVHQGDSEQQQELHGQLSSPRKREGVTREPRVWAGCIQSLVSQGFFFKFIF